MSGTWDEHQRKNGEDDGDDDGARGEPDPYPAQHDDSARVEGGAARDGGWVEGQGWRMKAPLEKKRQQVCVLVCLL